MAEDRSQAARRVRAIVRAAEKAALATLIGEDAAPYVSLVMVGTDHAARPLMLISALAEHTRNLAADPRAALLFDATAGHENPLTGPRVSVLGTAAPVDDEALLARYVRRFPDAADYLALGDFRLWRLEVARAHVVAGFGDIRWLAAEEATVAPAAALAEAEADILAHMNEAHGDALALYAAAAGRDADGPWTMTGIDPEGLDMRGPRGLVRIDFAAPVDGPATARATLAALARAARKAAEK